MPWRSARMRDSDEWVKETERESGRKGKMGRRQFAKESLINEHSLMYECIQSLTYSQLVWQCLNIQCLKRLLSLNYLNLSIEYLHIYRVFRIGWGLSRICMLIRLKIQYLIKTIYNLNKSLNFFIYFLFSMALFILLLTSFSFVQSLSFME